MHMYIAIVASASMRAHPCTHIYTCMYIFMSMRIDFLLLRWVPPKRHQCSVARAFTYVVMGTARVHVGRTSARAKSHSTHDPPVAGVARPWGGMREA